MNMKSTDHLPRELRLEILGAFESWIKEYVMQGYKPFLLTFMFHELPGNGRTMATIMRQDIEHFYRTILKWIVRKPRTAPIDQLPKFIVLPDRPVFKYQKQELDDVEINNGVHMHGIFLIPKISRLTCELDEHVRSKIHNYTNREYTRIRHIDVQKIKSRVGYTTGYALKGLKYDAAGYDDLLILPMPRSDLPPKQNR